MELSRVEILKERRRQNNRALWHGHFQHLLQRVFYQYNLFYDIFTSVSRKENYAQIRIAEGFGPFLPCKLLFYILK
jgi:hypothetical protein